MTTTDKTHGLTSHLELSARTGRFVGDLRIRLLDMIDAHGSISRAAPHVPMSYKAAWDAVDAMNNLAPCALVERTAGGRQGGGSRLTAYGRQVVAMYRVLAIGNQRALDRLASRLDPSVDAGEQRFHQLLRRMDLRTSARNQFACTVAGVHGGDVRCEVLLSIGDGGNTLVATVTREAVTQMGIDRGAGVMALIKASAVAVIAGGDVSGAGRNVLRGTVERIDCAAEHADVVVGIGGGKSVSAVVPARDVREQGLAPGQPASAVFKASSVVLADFS
jgi:molybdate transport system regulatory protein